MYVVYLCILAPLLQIGIALNEEETDLIPLSSNYDDVMVADIKDPEIWNSEEYVVLDTISKTLIEDICKNSNKLIYVTQEDVTIDCKSFFSEQTHDVEKRDADEPDTGSGHGDMIIETTTQAMPRPKITTLPPKKMNTQTEENDGEEQRTTVGKIVEVDEQEDKLTTVNAEEEEDDDKTTMTYIEDKTTVEAEDKTTLKAEDKTTVETEDETTVEAENKTTVEAEDQTTVEAEDQTTMANIEENKTTEKAEEEIIVQSPSKTDDETTKTEEKEHTESPLKPTNEETKPKEAEDMLSKENGDKKRGKGRNLMKQSTNEENRNDSEDSVETKESTSDTKKAGSKDTTILVVLFVAVVVVGAAAFGYNFIKKRRERSADLERVERASPIKRSFQNLTKTTEGEAEKNPLLNDKKEVEMVDMKKPVENGEKV